jgi:hypothetical protein
VSLSDPAGLHSRMEPGPHYPRRPTPNGGEAGARTTSARVRRCARSGSWMHRVFRRKGWLVPPSLLSDAADIALGLSGAKTHPCRIKAGAHWQAV